MNKKVKLSSLPREIVPHATVSGKNEVLVDHLPHVISATTILRTLHHQNQTKKPKLKR